MIYKLNPSERDTLLRFVAGKKAEAIDTMAQFNNKLPNWFETVESVIAQFDDKPKKRLLLLYSWDVYLLSSLDGIDAELPELYTRLKQEIRRLIGIRRPPPWLSKP